VYSTESDINTHNDSDSQHATLKTIPTEEKNGYSY